MGHDWASSMITASISCPIPTILLLLLFICFNCFIQGHMDSLLFMVGFLLPLLRDLFRGQYNDPSCCGGKRLDQEFRWFWSGHKTGIEKKVWGDGWERRWGGYMWMKEWEDQTINRANKWWKEERW